MLFVTLIRHPQTQPDPTVPAWQWGIGQALVAASYHGLSWPLAPGP